MVGKFVNEYADTKAILTNKTSNSFELYLYAKNNNGVDCYQWLTERDFSDKFEISIW